MCIVFTGHLSFAQTTSEYTVENYVNKYKEDAIREMHRSGVPASITLAQGILESGRGGSDLARKARNHFGIKCHTGWEGPSFIQDDDTKNECFRKYKTVLESYRDHSEFLSGRSRYASLFELNPKDYKAWAKGLKKAGYATDPKYPVRLIDIIEKNELYQYDNVRLAEVEKKKPVAKPKPQIVSKPTTTSDPAVTMNGRKVKVRNRIKSIVADKGDTPLKIANNFDMNLWQIYKYNDLKKGDTFKTGQIVYLQPKRNRGTKEYHVVQKGDDLHSISQTYGVKLAKLQKLNPPGAIGARGEKRIYLR